MELIEVLKRLEALRRVSPGATAREVPSGERQQPFGLLRSISKNRFWGGPWTPSFWWTPTREVVNGKSVIENLEFADYDSLADSCRDYAWVITQGAPYCAAWARCQADHDLHSLTVPSPYLRD